MKVGYADGAPLTTVSIDKAGAPIGCLGQVFDSKDARTT
jgi:hypothetical protein